MQTGRWRCGLSSKFFDHMLWICHARRLKDRLLSVKTSLLKAILLCATVPCQPGVCSGHNVGATAKNVEEHNSFFLALCAGNAPKFVPFIFKLLPVPLFVYRNCFCTLANYFISAKRIWTQASYLLHIGL